MFVMLETTADFGHSVQDGNFTLSQPLIIALNVHTHLPESYQW